LTAFSLLRILGAVIALIWANLDLIAPVAGEPLYYSNMYQGMVDFVILDHAPIGSFHDGHRTLTSIIW